MSDSYSIVLSGETTEGFTLEQVKMNVGKLFKLDEKKLSTLFVGKPVVVRRGLEKPQAIKMHTALSKAGAIVSIKKARAVKVESDVVDRQTKVAETAPQAASIECPRCGSEQPYSTSCIQCKMDLTLHLQRLQRKEKQRLFRQQSK